MLEQNLFKNVSKGSAFLWQTQTQTIEWYGTHKNERG